MTPMIYLACPYSHEDALVRESRFDAVNKIAGALITKGNLVFSPISHSHPIACAVELPNGWDFWVSFCKATIINCNTLVVLRLPGWEVSVGVAHEIRLATELNLPIVYVDYPLTDEQAANGIFNNKTCT